MADASGRCIPLWDASARMLQPLQEPLQLEDDGKPVDVAQFARFELNHRDIRCGVFLDLTVEFQCKGAEKRKVKQTFPEWTEGFTPSPALLKLTVTLEGSTKQLRCIASLWFQSRGTPSSAPRGCHVPQVEKLRVATLYGRLPTSPGSLAHNRLSHLSGTVRNLSLTLPNTSENFKRCTSCSQTLAPFSHTSQTNWP